MPSANKVTGEWEHSSKMEERHEDWERARRGNPFSKLTILDSGFLGPAFGTVFFLIILVALLWALKFANMVLQSATITILMESVINNLQWFFLFSIFVGYCDYFTQRTYAGYIVLWPIANAARVAFTVWILAWIFRVAGAALGSGLLFEVGVAARSSLAEIAAVFLVLGYAYVAAMAFLLRKRIRR